MLISGVFIHFLLHQLGKVDAKMDNVNKEFISPTFNFLTTKLIELRDWSDFNIVLWLPHTSFDEARNVLINNTKLQKMSFISIRNYSSPSKSTQEATNNDYVIHIIHIEDSYDKSHTQIVHHLLPQNSMKQLWKPVIFLAFNTTEKANETVAEQTNSYNNLRPDSNVLLAFSEKHNSSSKIEFSKDNENEVHNKNNSSNSSAADLANFIFVDKYTIKTNKSVQPVTITKASSSINISDLVFQSVWCRRSDFRNVLFKAAASDSKDYAFESKIRGTEFISGSAVSILRDMEYALNFHTQAKPHRFLKESDGLVINGISLQKNDVDIMISQNVLQPYILTSLKILQPTFLFNVIAFYSPPPSHMYQLYLLPFSTGVWYSIILTIVLLQLGMYIIFVTQNFMESMDNVLSQNCESERTSFLQFDSFCQAFSCIYAAWYQQGWYEQLKSMSSKILFFTTIFAGFICYSAFSGRITQTLALNKNPVETFTDLRNLQYSFFYSDGSNSLPTYSKVIQKYFEIPNAFQPLKATNAMKLLSLKTKRVAFLDYWESSELIIHGKFGHLKSMEERGMEKDNFCNEVRAVKVDDTYVRSGMILPFNSPFVEILNMKIMQIKERGLNHKYLTNYERYTRPFCQDPADLKHESLDMKATAYSIYLLLTGYLISGFLLITEILMYRVQFSKIPILL